MSFRHWLEIHNALDGIKTAIIGAMPDELQGDEESLLRSKTTDFGIEVQTRLKNLGIVTNVKDNDPQRWRDIQQAISRGIALNELISKIMGNETTPQPSIQTTQV